MAVQYLNNLLESILLNLQTEYNVYQVFDVNHANVVLNDVQQGSFPVAFFAISNQGTINLTNYKKSYPVYNVAVWLLNLYDEDNKSELNSNYEGLRLDALEFIQRFQRSEQYIRVPSNSTISANINEFDAQLDLLASAIQIEFTASIDINEDTTRVCAPLNVSSFTVNDDNLDNVIVDASNSSFRGVVSGATAGAHYWSFTLDSTTISINGLATDSLSPTDITALSSIGMINASGTYNSFTFEKNPDFVISFNFNIGVSHQYDFRDKGALSEATTGEIRKRLFISFFTNWNTKSEGAYEPLLVGGIKTWKFGDDVETGNNPNYTGSYLDGTVKEVFVVSNDFSLVTDVDFDGKKIVGHLGLQALTGINGDIDIGNNALLASVSYDSTTPKTVTRIAQNNTAITGNIDLFENQFIHSLNMAFSDNLLTNFKSGIGTITDSANFYTCVNLETLDLSETTFLAGSDIDASSGALNNISTFINPKIGSDVLFLELRQTQVTSYDCSDIILRGLDIRQSPNLTLIRLSNTPHSIEFLRANGCSNLLIFDINNVVVDNNTTNIIFSNSSLGSTLIDSIYNQIESSYDGFSSLSGLTINTTGNSAPTGASLTARNNLASAGTTILT